MRTAKNHSKMCSVGPCGRLKTHKQNLLFPFIFVLSYPPVQFSGSGILLRKMLKKKSGFSGFEGLISYMRVSYMRGVCVFVSDGFGPFSDRFGLFSDAFRPSWTTLILIKKNQISIGHGWGPSVPFRPSVPSPPAVAN